MVSFAPWRRRDPKAAIQAFWEWWRTVSDQVAAALSEQDDTAEGGRSRSSVPARITRALSQHVHAIHPELSWELIDGVLARHALVLTPEGSPGLRPLTERWRRSGPGDNETWEYYPARPPNPAALHGELRIGKRVIAPKLARFGTEVDHDRGRVHVIVSHPDLPYLEDADRLRLAFLLLDWVLGEDDVERWIGEVRFSENEQEMDGRRMRAVVSELSREFTGVHWAQLEGIDEQGRKATVQVRVPLPRLDHPLFDLHGTVWFPFQTLPAEPEKNDDPFAPIEPDPAEMLEIEGMTRGLVALLGGSAVLAAMVTLPDRLTLHIYADSDGVVAEQVGVWAQQQKRPVRVEWESDPSWETVRHFV